MRNHPHPLHPEPPRLPLHMLDQHPPYPTPLRPIRHEHQIQLTRLHHQRIKPQNPPRFPLLTPVTTPSGAAPFHRHKNPMRLNVIRPHPIPLNHRRILPLICPRPPHQPSKPPPIPPHSPPHDHVPHPKLTHANHTHFPHTTHHPDPDNNTRH